MELCRVPPVRYRQVDRALARLAVTAPGHRPDGRPGIIEIVNQARAENLAQRHVAGLGISTDPLDIPCLGPKRDSVLDRSRRKVRPNEDRLADRSSARCVEGGIPCNRLDERSVAGSRALFTQTREPELDDAGHRSGHPYCRRRYEHSSLVHLPLAAF
jgi:hypothetical protein